MKKITTLFKKDPLHVKLVINEVNAGNEWVMKGEAIPTRKFDGSAAAIINGELYKRYDAKRGKKVPHGAIPCQDPDDVTGHWPHWVKCNPRKPEDQFFIEAFNNLLVKEDGTYELVGPKVQSNPENYNEHALVRHGSVVLQLPSLTYEGLKEWLCDDNNDIEGIVFHHINDGRMCKLRKSDFGVKRKKD